jgi:hypothetical protein
VTRFYQGFQWRWVVLAIDDPQAPTLRITSFLDPLALDATVTRTLNEPLTIELTVPSDQAQVWLEDATDGEPLVAEGQRVIVGMRPENAGSTNLWVPRAAGILLQPDDAASANEGSGTGRSRLLALDPWNTLYRRPVCQPDGTLPDADLGIRYPVGTEPQDIILDLLVNTAVNHGATMIEATGTIETLDPITEAIVFERGLTVGEAWKQMCDADLCDIVLDPILELGAGTIARLNVYARAGSAEYAARFVYDGWGRSVTDISRVEDGTERVNVVQEFSGQGGIEVPIQTSAGSVNRFGEWWLIKAQEKTTTLTVAEDLARGDLEQRLDGVRTISFTPTPERSPVPFTDYDIGDTVTVFSTARSLRKEISGNWRVTSIPVVLAGGEPERVEALEVTSDDYPDT